MTFSVGSFAIIVCHNLQESLAALRAEYQDELNRQNKLINSLENLIQVQKESLRTLEVKLDDRENVANIPKSDANEKRITEENRYANNRRRRPSKKNKANYLLAYTLTLIPNPSKCSIE